MEKFPQANYSPKNEASNQQFEGRAKVRNAQRSLKEKFFGKNEVSGMDMLREEADQVNSLVDKSSKQEEKYSDLGKRSSQEAADEILAGGEFNPMPEDIKFGELLRSKYPDILRSLSHNMFSAALRQAEEIADTMSAYEGEAFEEGVQRSIQMKLDTMIRVNDIDAMRHTLESPDKERLVEAGVAESLLRMPRELIASPAYIRHAMNFIVIALDKGVDGGSESIRVYSELKKLFNELKAIEAASST